MYMHEHIPHPTKQFSIKHNDNDNYNDLQFKNRKLTLYYNVQQFVGIDNLMASLESENRATF